MKTFIMFHIVKKINHLKNKKNISILFRGVLFTTSLFFVIYLIQNNKSDLNLLDLSLLPKVFIISFVPSFIGMLFQIKQLQLILHSEEVILPYRDILFIVAKSNIARYIPGGVWNHLSIAVDLKNKLNKKISTKNIGKVLIINTVIILISGVFFLIFFLPKPYMIPFLFFYSITIFFLPKVFEKFFLKTKVLDLFLSYIYSIIFWFFSAASFYLFYFLLTKNLKLNLIEGIKIGSSFVVSWVIGFLAIPIPSGLGVREFTMKILLRQIISLVDVGATLSLTYRFLILFRDLIILLISQIWLIGDKLKILKKFYKYF